MNTPLVVDTPNDPEFLKHLDVALRFARGKHKNK
jgi:hypothetical protein